MILADVKFPPGFENNVEKQEIYLNNVKKNALSFLNLFILGNNRNIQDSKARLNKLQEYIYRLYNININIYNIFKFAINHLNYNSTRNFITLDSALKVKGVKLLTILKIIRYGALGIVGSNVLGKCLDQAFKATYINNFLVTYRIRQWV